MSTSAYQRLNRVLDDAGFDAFVEELCAKFYTAWRPSPGCCNGWPAAATGPRGRRKQPT